MTKAEQRAVYRVLYQAARKRAVRAMKRHDTARNADWRNAWERSMNLWAGIAREHAKALHANRA